MTAARLLTLFCFLIAGCAHRPPVLTIHLVPTQATYSAMFTKGDRIRIVAEHQEGLSTFDHWTVQNLTLPDSKTSDCVATVQTTGGILIHASYVTLPPPVRTLIRPAQDLP